MNLSGFQQQARQYSTACSSLSSRDLRRPRPTFSATPAFKPAYETESTKKHTPFGTKNSSNSKPAKVALLGARGYTGQALINLLSSHPYMDLRHVSSRELAGQKLKGYSKREITYESLTHDDVRKMPSIDIWILALPNCDAKP